MPTKRRPINRLARLGDLDPALASYLLDGDLRAALDDLRAREQPRLVLWQHHALARLWREHRAELEAEAGRRRIKAWWPQHEAETRRRIAAA